MKGYARGALALLPLLVGLGLAALWQAGLWPNPILYLRADAGTVFLLLGILASALWAGALASWLLARRGFARVLANWRAAQAEAHRRFIRRLDHELKNPITAIRAGLANLDQRDSAALVSVHKQVDRLARLIGELRKLADMDAQPLDQEAVNLGELLSEVVDQMQDRPQDARCRIRLTLPQAPWPLPPVAGDRDLLLVALHNLVDNAAKFSRPEDTIEIRGFEDGASVVVEVADTGPGVPEEELPHLGEELYRGSAAMRVEGSGLGLALVQAIVNRHRGTMAIRSREGRGTVVTLRLLAARG